MKSFCSAKASLIFSTKIFSVLGYKVIKHETSWALNELLKLTMLWTTGPRTSFSEQNNRRPSCVLTVIYTKFPKRKTSEKNHSLKWLHFLKQLNCIISLNKSTKYILTPSLRIMTSYTVGMKILCITQIGSILFRNDSRCWKNAL